MSGTYICIYIAIQVCLVGSQFFIFTYLRKPGSMTRSRYLFYFCTFTIHYQWYLVKLRLLPFTCQLEQPIMQHTYGIFHYYDPTNSGFRFYVIKILIIASRKTSIECRWGSRSQQLCGFFCTCLHCILPGVWVTAGLAIFSAFSS